MSRIVLGNAGSNKLILGRRAGAATVVIDHPSVSRAHAAFERVNGVWQVTDLGSTNGTFVSGARIGAPTTISAGNRIDVGSLSFTLAGDTLQPVIANAGATLRIEGLSYTPDGNGAPRLLNNIDLYVPGSGLVCVLGPSGSGKSTLLRAIGGRITPSNGRVLVDDIDLHAQYARVKTRVGFVPQHEALRDELTVGDMLRYTSRLRLTSDVTADEIEENIENLCARVGLGERIDTSIRALSGGQRRRVGLVNELLARPSLVLLDEITSGLDEEAAHIIMGLVREFASDGMTVLCVTHTVAAIEPYADSVLVLAPGGVPSYFGAPTGLLPAFSIKGLGDLYARLKQRDPEHWRAAFASTSPRARALPKSESNAEMDGASKTSLWRRGVRQVRLTLVLCARYIDVITGDSLALMLGLLQGVAIGLALRLLFGSDALTQPRVLQLGFLVVMSSFWFGCNNAVKEIVKERALLSQEWAAGLPLFAYGLSKVLVLSLLATVQVALLVLTLVALRIQFSHAPDLVVLGLAGAWTGTAIGLLVSARARTTDAANVVLPLLLIPQFLFAEALVAPLSEPARWLAKIGVSAYWLFEGVRSAFGVPGASAMNAYLALGAHALLSLVAALIVLRLAMQRQTK